MPMYAGVDGAKRKLTAIPVGIDGATKNVKAFWANDETGAKRKIFETSAIYGAEWDGSSKTTWSRTDAAANFENPNPAVNNGTGSSPFDDIMPWAGMQLYEDPVAGTLVSIPKYWYKWTRNGTSMKLQISSEPQEGFYVSPAHADRGDGKGERALVYVGRYHCNKSYRSGSGGFPAGAMSRATARESIHGLGDTYWQYDFAMYWTVMLLYLVEFANWNSQSSVGYGCSPDGRPFSVGATDSMLYHTGTNASKRTEYGSVQYRHIEGLWDNVQDWCDGIRFSDTAIFCINNPADFSDTIGGINVGNRTNQFGFISGWTEPTAKGVEYAIYPNYVSGSETTYVCDYCVYNSSSHVLAVGSDFSKDQSRGAFYLDSPQRALGNIGCRLQKLP